MTDTLRAHPRWVAGAAAVVVAGCLAGLAGALAGASSTAAGPVPAERPGWRLVWADEFQGSGLDRTSWDVEDRSTFGEANLELACLMDRPENVRVADGVLSLVAVREDEPVPCGRSDRRFPAGRDHTSAMVSTKGLREWQYGRFEVRARLPTAPGTSRGLWPAFWLRPTAGGEGELDVLEALGSGPGDAEWNRVHHTVWFDYERTHPPQAHTHTFPDGGPSDGMHTYAAEWEPGVIRWYVDGVLTHQRDRTTTPWLDEAFDEPFFIRLNLAVGGRWPGSPDGDTALPAAFEIDHVRVYQR